jgi:hypothetical protein
VHGTDNLSDWVSEQHRHAVGDQHRHRKLGFGGDQRIGGRRWRGQRTVNRSNGTTVHLLHPDQPLRSKPNTGGQPLTVCRHRR